MQINLEPIGYVSNNRAFPIDDNWKELSEINLVDSISEEALLGIGSFSHLEIIYYFDKVDNDKIKLSNHPRGDENYPCVGIFAQRKKERPNRLGLCTVELIEVKNKKIVVKYLDAINGTPVLDIKPVMKEFEPKSDIKQPNWASEIMKNYW